MPAANANHYHSGYKDEEVHLKALFPNELRHPDSHRDPRPFVAVHDDVLGSSQYRNHAHQNV